MRKSIVLVAGGTGGHILPAISFGNWINKNKKDYDVYHICGNRELELEIHNALDTSPFIVEMDGSPLSGKNIIQRIHRFFSLFTSFFKIRKFLDEKDPVCCVLFAGYLSLPAMFACKSLGIYTVLHEQNAYAGKVTKIAAKIGLDIYSGWKDCFPLNNSQYTPIGVPVRELEAHTNDFAWNSIGFDCPLPKSPRILVLSGSLGSMSVKNMIAQIAEKEKFKNYSFIVPAISDSVCRLQKNVYLTPKIWDVSLLYTIADILVVRAGGSTLSEVANSFLPALIVPWNSAADNHQNFNAISFVAENEGLIHNENESIDDFEKKLLKLVEIFEKKEEKYSTRLYNDKSNLICENFWFALSPKFERRN
ncbi:MAG: UDP-N-acetylglucosamine--N-acetylmuramyl-(pentapeptide) pyrophosphoryl-undecaprenol N-acetylglucosamine transferase [Synergistaceae bacterium]